MSWRTGGFGAVAAAALLLASGCGPLARPTSPRAAPVVKPVAKAAPGKPDTLGAPRGIAPGVVVREGAVRPLGQRSRVWVYLPGRPPSEKLPCILIAPAGSRLFHGMALADGDRPEHIPYAQAGFAVVTYELDGPMADNPSDEEAIGAARAFVAAEAGIANAKAALDYAAASEKLVDTSRVYAVGHSSAATLALVLAANEPRIKACVAYAPACDVPARVGPQLVETLGRVIPDFAGFIQRTSPMSNVNRIKCPVLLFHADDDDNVPTADVAAFASALKQHNPAVQFTRVPSGGHYESMVQQGIPMGIQWLKSLRR